MTRTNEGRWLVIGAGVSGLGAARFLAKRGDLVRVSERSRLSPEKAAAFIDAGVELKDGGHDLSHLDGITNVVVSPGLPPTHPLLVEAGKRLLPVISEIDLALLEYAKPGRHVIAVTGTNGKSTTCAMIGHLLEKLGKTVVVGGNFGDPPTAMLADGRVPDYLVLELSSYQLEQSNLVAPEVAVFTSFSFDHLARHGSLAGYLKAKWRIFDHLPAGSLSLVPDGILAVSRKEGLKDPSGLTVVQPEVPSPFAAYGITEVHNQLNATFAVLTVQHLTKKSAKELTPLLADFRGLPHRCELVGRLGPNGTGAAIINDSKSTNVESTLVALQSQPKPVILMMGGQGKGEPYAPILAERAKIAALVTFGATGPIIAAELQDKLPTHAFPTLKAALTEMDALLAKYGCGVLFSPGCASFDEFDNYSHRGEVFKAGMQRLL